MREQEEAGVRDQGLGIGDVSPTPNPQPPTTTTELGLEVPVKTGEEWREHTAERWRERDRETYDQCVHLIRSGVMNQSELARIFGKSRNSIQALMLSDEFTPGEIENIIKKSALIGVAQGLDKVMELTDKARATKDLGGVAIALTTQHNIKQLASGGPTAIKEVHHRFSVDDYERLKAEASRKRLNEGGPVVDVVPDDLKTAVRLEAEA